MAKRFIWLNEAKERINEFTIVYMITLGLNVNKAFRKCMNTKCVETTQPFIKDTHLKNKI